MVQLLIIYFVIFANVHIDKWVVGFIAFGINSGAYIAEIVRGGILSVNIGQTEAGRSLGMTHKADYGKHCYAAGYEKYSAGAW